MRTRELSAAMASVRPIHARIHTIRGVKRNRDRFPADFMFQLRPSEIAGLRSQIAISSAGHGGRRYPPYVFTEQGVAMLSGLLRSPRAIAVNIEIMRAFVYLRRLVVTHTELAQKLADLVGFGFRRS